MTTGRKTKEPRHSLKAWLCTPRKAYWCLYYQIKLKRLVKKCGGIAGFLDKCREMGWPVEVSDDTTTVTGPNGVKFHFKTLQD